MTEISRSSRMSQSQSSASGSVVCWNEATDVDGRVRPHWSRLHEEIQQWTPEERGSIATAACRLIEDLGTTFNVFSDAGGAGQPYELDPIPLLISGAEWAKVAAGFAQRGRLLDAILVDLYGPQTLLTKGLIPPDLVHSSVSFLAHVRGSQPPGGRFLHAGGCDLIRSATGAWTVLRDHTRIPGGLGQALENRKVISGLLGDSFDSLQIAPLTGFMEAEGEMLRSLAIGRNHGANVVFLTPGFRHPSYFEHAYKARLLGFPLVESADLTVRERRLFLKTLGGLRPVDVVVCRVDHDGLDPLEFWSDHCDGVPGLIEAWRARHAVISNAPGAGFASSPALMSFLPRICREWFGEVLTLPFVETWWLGQPEVRARVFEQFHRYVLMSAAPMLDPLLPLQCSGLSPAARKQWMQVIQARPHDFVVQADMRPSEMPTIENRQIRQRPVLWRAFALFRANDALVLPGGLARVGRGNLPPQLWPGQAGFTKDVWVSGVPENISNGSRYSREPSAAKAIPAQEVPSRIAEQLFWVGRYAERIELATRLLRVALRCLAGEAGRFQQDRFSACLTLLQAVGLISKGSAIPPTRAVRLLSSLIHDPSVNKSIRSLTCMLLQNAAAARDRLSDDTWRFFNRLDGIVHPSETAPSSAEINRTLDNLVLHLAAFAGMQAENMTRGHGWRFLETGRRVERGLGALLLLESAAKDPLGVLGLLDPLLETCDSVMTYRRRHFSSPQLDPVIELIFADPTNPRSVRYQMDVIHTEIDRFPGRVDFGLMPRIRKESALLAASCSIPKDGTLPDFENLGEALESFSDLLTQHFFSHSVRRVY